MLVARSPAYPALPSILGFVLPSRPLHYLLDHRAADGRYWSGRYWGNRTNFSLDHSYAAPKESRSVRGGKGERIP